MRVRDVATGIAVVVAFIVLVIACIVFDTLLSVLWNYKWYCVVVGLILYTTFDKLIPPKS